jgi:hypothetical protein
MPIHRLLLGALFLSLGVASDAGAVEIVSGEIPLDTDQSAICTVLNIGHGPVQAAVLIAVDGGSGMVSTCTSLMPGAACRNQLGASGPIDVYCRATVSSKPNVRGVLTNPTTGATVELH